MNITKNILLVLFSLVSTINFAQNTSELDCGNGFETIEVEVESQKSVSYKVIYSQKLYTEDSFEFSEGVITTSLEVILDKNIIRVLTSVTRKNRLNVFINSNERIRVTGEISTTVFISIRLKSLVLLTSNTNISISCM